MAPENQATMSDSRFLSGKVARHSLPLFETRPDAAAPVLKRLNLGQGELAQVHDGGEPIQYLAVLEWRPGCIRGNHYHREKRESVYMVCGEVDLVLEDLENGERAEMRLVAGDKVSLPPGIAHAFRPVTPGWALEFTPHPLDLTDSHRHEVIPAGGAR